MALWLFKQEPDCYSFDNLERDKSTLWDGVTNNLARQNLRKVQKGDRILFYHTGKEKAIVGVMKAESGPLPDPSSDDAKSVVVKVKPVKRFRQPVTLLHIKSEPKFSNWDLVRNSRLSVMPVSEELWQRIEELSQEEGRTIED